MKTTYKIIAVVSSMMMVLISCTKKDYVAQEDAPTQTIQQMQENRIDGGDFTLSPDDAIKVALLNDINTTATKSTQAKSVKDVVTIKGKSNDPIIYAVNYNDKQGFTLVSASKSYYPVLAMVGKGEFGPDCYKTGMAVLLEEYEQGIEYCKTLPEDSLRIFKTLWRQYEKSGKKVIPQTKSDIMSLISQSTAQWTSDGYEYMSLAETNGIPPWDMPLSIYTQWYEIAETFGNPMYDYENYSFLVYKNQNDVTIVPSCQMETEWDQYNGYNALLTPINGVLPPVGCAAVAVGQIMKYHQWPNTISWDLMPNLTPSSATAQFLKDLGNSIHTNYYVNISIADNLIVDSVLNSTYNYTSHYEANNYANISASLRNGCPVYMAGWVQGTQIGHAWVCSEEKKIVVDECYILMIVSQNQPLEFIVGGRHAINNGIYTYYYMNWGRRGQYNGWFIQGNVNTSLGNFNSNRHNIICSPNRN